MKKILYISYDGLTDPLGQSQVLPYLKELSKKEFQFTVLSFEKKDRYQREKEFVNAITDASGIKWVPLSFTARPPVFSKIYDRWKMRHIAIRLNQKEKFDMIHCRSYVAAEIGLSFKKKFNTKFLFDMRGFWADEKVDNGQWDLKKTVYRKIYQYYKKKEKKFLLNADGIVSLTEKGKKYLQSKPEFSNLLIDVIPCCADFEHFDYNKMSLEKLSIIKNRIQIPEEVNVIIYSGSTGGWYMTKEMFSFFKVLVDRYPEYVMLILTKDNRQKINEEAAEAGIPSNKIFVTYSTRNELPEFLALGTCSIFFIRNTFSKIASSPTKHAELMGMGIPIICNDIGDTGSIVNSTKTGIVINEFSEEIFQQAVKGINNLEKIDKKYIRNCGKEIFDLEKGILKYSDLYNRILN